MLNNHYYSLSKAYVFVLVLVLLSTGMYAQNVGIGTALPNTGLDVVRDFALREAAAVTINASNQIDPSTGSHVRVTGAGTINEILNPQNGKVLYLINNSGGAITLANNTPPASSNKIITGSGADYSLPNGATAHLIYNATNQAWQLAGVSPGATSTNNAWLLLGNAGTNPAVNFVGTTDCNSLRFRVNNQFSGLIECAANDGNTAFGYNTMANPTAVGAIRNVAIGDSVLGALNPTKIGGWEGNDNVAVGYRALGRNIDGHVNVAVGSGALSRCNSSYNVAVGAGALRNSTTGNSNTAVGFASMMSNTTGTSNTAIGYEVLPFSITGNWNVGTGQWALRYNTTGTGNVATGFAPLHYNNTGNYNTATGFQALMSNHDGNDNVATGSQAMYSNIHGNSNVAAGSSALYSNTSGNCNVAVGSSAGITNDKGNENVYIGCNADAAADNLTNSTAIGANARVDASNSMVLGSIIGVNSAMANTNVGIGTTIPNTALDIARDLALRESPAVPIVTNQITPGTASHLRVTGAGTINEILNPQNGKVLYLINNSGGAITLANNTPPASSNKIITGSGANYSLPNGATAHLIYNPTNAAWELAGVSPGAAGWLLTGNAGTNPATDFLGTTDAKSLRFRVNNQFSGLIEHAANDGNTAFGYNTMANPTAVGAIRNVAIGDSVLGLVTGGPFIYNGDYNVGVGYRALASNTTGHANVAVGSSALSKANSSFNVAVGAGTLTSNTTGNSNVGVGFAALQSNTIGNSNIAIGFEALSFNTIGNWNVGTGQWALRYNNTGTGNVASGFAALYDNNGNYNTATGFQALEFNNTGTYNTAAGNHALRFNTTGGCNVAVGNSAGITNDKGNENVYIGCGADAAADNFSNAIAIGSGAVVDASDKIRMGNSAITVAETEISWTTSSDKNKKSDIKHDVPGLKFIKQLQPVTYYYNSHLQAHGKEKSIRYTGLLAQDVDSVLRGLGIVSSIVSKPNADGSGSWGIRYAELVMPLIKGMQEQQAQIEALQQENAELKADNAELKALTAKLEAEQASLKAAFEARLKLLEDRAGIKAQK